jgi:hypothetical protein
MSETVLEAAEDALAPGLEAFGYELADNALARAHAVDLAT